VTADGGAIDDVKTRIKKANGTFVELHQLWKNEDISRKTKIQIFNNNVKSVLLYGCQMWKVTTQITNKLQVFVNRCLRRILGIRWLEVVHSVELWEAAGEKSIVLQIKKRKWRWIGHILRKNDGQTEKQALDWNLQGVKRRERPKQTWKRTVVETAAKCCKTWSEVKRLVKNRVRWRCFTDALCS
jgi:hypothetical protein